MIFSLINKKNHLNFLNVSVKNFIIELQAKTLDKEEEEYVSEMRKMSHKKDGAEIESDVPEASFNIMPLFAVISTTRTYTGLKLTEVPDTSERFVCILPPLDQVCGPPSIKLA